MVRSLRYTALAALTALAACNSGSGPSTGTQVTFNLGTQGSTLGALRGDTLTANNDALVIDTVEVILRDLRFHRASEAGCDLEDDSLESGSIRHEAGGSGSSGDDGNDGVHDACESFNAGPYLLNLPLGTGVARGFSVAVDTGSYDQLRLKIHKPETNGSDPKDAAFIAAHPEFAGVSIRAVGSFDGQPFAFTSDLGAEQTMNLVPPIIVTDAVTNLDITINVDLATWFSDGAGGLVDPNSGNHGGANDNLVNDNIKTSFNAFRDENRDGHDDPSDED
ncbi:MAG: hypothetical protein ABI587_16010 [Gemmatimonadales bacterium]